MVSELIGSNLTKPFDEAVKDKIYDKVEQTRRPKIQLERLRGRGLVKKGFEKTVDLAEKPCGPKRRVRPDSWNVLPIGERFDGP